MRLLSCFVEDPWAGLTAEKLIGSMHPKRLDVSTFGSLSGPFGGYL